MIVYSTVVDLGEHVYILCKGKHFSKQVCIQNQSVNRVMDLQYNVEMNKRFNPHSRKLFVNTSYPLSVYNLLDIAPAHKFPMEVTEGTQ